MTNIFNIDATSNKFSLSKLEEGTYSGHVKNTDYETGIEYETAKSWLVSKAENLKQSNFRTGVASADTFFVTGNVCEIVYLTIARTTCVIRKLTKLLI